MAHMERRRAELRQLYAARIAPLTEAQLVPHRDRSRALVWSLGLMAAATALAAGLLFLFPWPVAWWGDPRSLIRVGIVCVALGWVYLQFQRRVVPVALGAPAIDALIARDILPRTFAALRPGASYTPDGAIDRGWIRRSALLQATTSYEAAHLVRWSVEGRRRELADVDAERSSRSAHRDHSSTTVVFKGLVATAALARDVGGQVRVWSDDLIHPSPDAVSGLPPVDPTRLGAIRAGLPPQEALTAPFHVDARDVAVAEDVMNARVVALLNDAHAAGHRLRLTVAHRELIVAVDLGRRWFRGLSVSFDEDHVVRMGEVLDLVDALAAAVEGETATSSSSF